MNHIKIAQAYDQAGKYEIADTIDKFVKLATDLTALNAIPGSSYLTSPGILKDTALGQQGMGLTVNPLYSSFLSANGPENPLEVPAFQPGMSADDYAKELYEWERTPEVQNWYNQQSARLNSYIEFLDHYPGIKPEVAKKLSEQAREYLQTFNKLPSMLPNSETSELPSDIQNLADNYAKYIAKLNSV